MLRARPRASIRRGSGTGRDGDRKPLPRRRGGDRPRSGGSRDGERSRTDVRGAGDRRASTVRPVTASGSRTTSARDGERSRITVRSAGLSKSMLRRGSGSRTAVTPRDGERRRPGSPAVSGSLFRRACGDRPADGGPPRDGERKSYGRPQRDGDRPSYAGLRGMVSGSRTPASAWRRAPPTAVLRVTVSGSRTGVRSATVIDRRTAALHVGRPQAPPAAQRVLMTGAAGPGRRPPRGARASRGCAAPGRARRLRTADAPAPR